MQSKILNTLAFTTLILSSTSSFAVEVCNQDTQVCRNEYAARSEQDCSDLNSEMANWFRDNKNYNKSAPIEKTLGPIRDQGSIGWCFAHAAADLMTQESGQYISAAQIAKNYFTKSKIAWIWGGKEGGTINDAINLSLNKPMCDENGFSSRGVTIEDAKKIDCQNPVVTMDHYKTRAYVTQGVSAGATVFPELDSALESGKIVGIHYNANKAYNGAKDSLLNGWANHASTIVSRYFDRDEKVCRYIVRNTWGSSCYNAQAGVKCKQGYYSLTEENLNRSLGGIVLLKEK